MSLTPPVPMTRRTLLFVGCAVLGALLVGLLILLVIRGGSDGVVRGDTSVGGVPIGGLSRDAAIAKLKQELTPRLDDPIDVVVLDQHERLDPVRAGLSVDIPATVDAALERSGVLGSLGDDALAPVVEVDDDKMKPTMRQLGGKFDHPVREGEIKFDGAHPVAVHPQPGVNLDQDGAIAAVREAFLDTTDPIRLPADMSDPQVSAEEIDRATREAAQPAVAAPLVIADGQRQAVVPPERLVNFLSFAPVDGRLELRVNGQGLADEVDAELGTLNGRPVDAGFRIVANRPQVIPSRPGRSIDVPALEQSAAQRVVSTDDRTVQIVRIDSEPEFTTAEAEQLGIVEQLSTFTQNFPYAAYRKQNIGEGARRLNGKMLQPGEIFSLNDTIGERTRENGYTEGYVITGGRFIKELGGGVSTLATTTWDNAFFAGLERVEQRAHSLYISRYKAGLEATVSYGTLDLRFKNDSPHGVYITASTTDTSVTVSMWGTKRYDVVAVPEPQPGRSAAEVPGRYNVTKPKTIYIDEKPKAGQPACEEQDGVDGFHVDVNRVFRPVGGGPAIKTEKLTTRYSATNEIVCGPKPKPKATKTPDPTPNIEQGGPRRVE